MLRRPSRARLPRSDVARCSVLVGFVYPAWQSWKALESSKAGDAAKAGGAPSQSQSAWLTYWVVFSLFNVVEHLADVLVSWCAAMLRNARNRCAVLSSALRVAHLCHPTRPRIPFYYIAKLAFVIWLQAPQTRGASVLQVHYITPLLHKHENAIDSVLEESMKKVRLRRHLCSHRALASDGAARGAGRGYVHGVPLAQ